MKKFEVGKTYSMFSPGDQNCTWIYTVTKRTACTVTLTDDHGNTKTCRISKQSSEWRKAETVYPLGQYSLCPSLSADAEVEPEQEAVTEEYSISSDFLKAALLGGLSGKLSAKQMDFIARIAEQASTVI